MTTSPVPRTGEPAGRRAARWQFAGGPGAAPRARHLAATTLRDWCLSGIADDVLLLIGELVANAALHAGGPITLQLRGDSTTVYCEVRDTSPWSPRLRAVTCTDVGGRGLHLLAALAPIHGWYPTPAGKAVWFTLTERTAASLARAPG